MNAFTKLINSVKSANREDMSNEYTETFTSSECERIYKHFNPHNRKFKQGWGDHLTNEMKAGKFAFNGETCKFDVNGNLIDGQHRFYAGWKSGKGIKTVIVTGLPPEAQDTIDVGIKRSVSDFLGLKNVKYASKLGAVANLSLRYESGTILSRVRPASHPEVWEWLENNPTAVDLYTKVSGWAPPQKCGVPESMLTTLLIQAEKAGKLDKAEEFVRQYSTSVGIEEGSGVHRFVKFVRNNDRQYGRPTQSVYFAALIRCFNDFASGKFVKRSFSTNDIVERLNKSGFPKIA